MFSSVKCRNCNFLTVIGQLESHDTMLRSDWSVMDKKLVFLLVNFSLTFKWLSFSSWVTHMICNFQDLLMSVKAAMNSSYHCSTDETTILTDSAQLRVTEAEFPLVLFVSAAVSGEELVSTLGSERLDGAGAEEH